MNNVFKGFGTKRNVMLLLVLLARMYQKGISKPDQVFCIYLWRNEASFMPLHHISREELCASVHLAERLLYRATARRGTKQRQDKLN